MIKAAIFDLDGTLAYTAPDLLYSMNLMLKDFDFETIDMERLMGGINYGSRHFVKMSLPESVRDNDELVNKAFDVYVNHYSKYCTDKVCLYDGIYDMLSELRKSGIKLAVLSNKDDGHTKAVVNKIAPNEFELVIGFNGQFPHKPDPASTRYIIDKFGTKNDEVLYVGDSPVDMQTGKNAGLFTIGVSWGYASKIALEEKNPDCIIDSPSEIFKYIK